MSSDKFTMATVEEVTLDVIIAIRGRYPKQPEKNYICNYLIASTESEKLRTENWIDTLLELS